MQKLMTCLGFNGRAEEAVRFYTSIFKNSKILSTSRVGDAGPGPKGSVLAIWFELDGQQFLALNGGPPFTFTIGMSIVVNCRTQEEIDYYWTKLTEDGGQESQCGWLSDKFGVSWQIVPEAVGRMLSDSDGRRADRVLQAVFAMDKLDLATLQRAYDVK